MTSSFDAYDLMRRSILSSIMGLRRKPRPSTTVERTTPGTACSSSSLPRVVHQPEIERTPHDIYREIVVECEQFERSGTSTPLSDFDSSPTSPNDLPITSPPPPPSNLPLSPPPSLIASPYPFPLEPFVAEPHAQPYTLMLPEDSYRGALMGAPPPYSVMPAAQLEDIPRVFPEALVGPFVDQAVMLPQIKQEDNMGAISIEEIVKLVVSAMKNSGLAEAEKESPEEILRRKRQQNNEAAARYRKRQREARNIAEGELEQLLRRNENLRQTVEKMQVEIAELKRAVLEGHSS